MPQLKTDLQHLLSAVIKHGGYDTDFFRSLQDAIKTSAEQRALKRQPEPACTHADCAYMGHGPIGDANKPDLDTWKCRGCNTYFKTPHQQPPPAPPEPKFNEQQAKAWTEVHAALFAGQHNGSMRKRLGHMSGIQSALTEIRELQHYRVWAFELKKWLTFYRDAAIAASNRSGGAHYSGDKANECLANEPGGVT